MWRDLRGVFIGATLGVFCGVLIASTYFSRQQPSPPADLNDHDAKMTHCVDRIIEIAKPPQMNVGVYERIWRLCGNQIFNGLYLSDFAIRKEKFVQQELDERVNLWMVVAITISGVLLAGAQLLMSYRLAERGSGEFAQDSEVAIQSGRISLRSSVTGALILTLSFAFFMVYVHWIYSVHEVPVGRPGNLETPTEVTVAESPAADANRLPKRDVNQRAGNEPGP